MDAVLNRKLEQMPDLTLYMTTEDAAQRLGYHLESIRRMLREKELEGKKWGRYWLISKKSVEEYKKRNDGLSKFDPRRGN
jgi:excisionase family DNA binding protein